MRKRGQVTKTTFADSAVATRSYDAAGNVLAQTDELWPYMDKHLRLLEA